MRWVEHRGSEALDQGQLVILGFNSEGYVVYANSVLLRLIWLPIDKVRGRDCFDRLFGMEQPAELRDVLLMDGEARGAFPRYRSHILTRNGDCHLVDWFTTRRLDPLRTPAVFIFGEDVTHRRDPLALVEAAEEIASAVFAGGDAHAALRLIAQRALDLVGFRRTTSGLYGMWPSDSLLRTSEVSASPERGLSPAGSWRAARR